MKIKTLAVRWFCRMCWEHGTAMATITPLNNRYTPPTKEELLKMAYLCHISALTNKTLKCPKPDLRLHYDSKEETTY